MNDWELNPLNYLQDSEGFVLKKDGTPKKKGGRPKGSKSRGYNYHSETFSTLSSCFWHLYIIWLQKIEVK